MVLAGVHGGDDKRCSTVGMIRGMAGVSKDLAWGDVFSVGM